MISLQILSSFATLVFLKPGHLKETDFLWSKEGS